ncbi:MAG: L-lactate dehydrogenase [Alphaproteobacteria bacterium]|nr:L-lactate dehydrogenase [Alphaproteobacteria bacterium]
MKIGIIGAGGVGSATAFALIMRGVARKIVLIDSDDARAQSQAEDIAHAAPFAFANKIKAGTYPDLAGADVVIITAGANQKPGQTRNDLLAVNVKIFENIIPQVVKYAPQSILLIAANPVDVMTEVALKLSGLPQTKVFGSGTVLDTARFRTLLGYHLGVSPKSIHANVLGEHGDSEVLIWSNAVAGTIQIERLAQDMQKTLDEDTKAQIDKNVRNAAYQIIAGKGSTTFGIAGALTRICQAIGSNEYAILNVSSHHKEIEGVKDICISMPCIIGKRGIHNKLSPSFANEEHNLLQKSAETIAKFTQIALENLH